MSDVTEILSFGQSVDDDFVVVELDKGTHGDVTQFLPEDEVFILVHHGENVSEVRALDTADGTIELLGVVSRENEVELTFSPEKEEAELPHIPTGLVAVKAFGMGSEIVAEGESRTVMASVIPAIATVKYSYQATRYRYKLPLGFELVGDSFPVGFYVETKKV